MLLSDLLGFGDVAENGFGLVFRQTLEVSVAWERTRWRVAWLIGPHLDFGHTLPGVRGSFGAESDFWARAFSV